ncbi:coproporphyrinogen-III oxidase family protein [Dehalobacter restrictus]|uniref:coproporphyrinogen-III oxidase family protein n=1 Tax=Dehalobacter restrictus TaxID=55583 RepID=UPI00338E5CAF
MINELVRESEWHNLFPKVDQEYVWEYPMFRGNSLDTNSFFAEKNRAISNNIGIYIHVPFCKYRCPMCSFYMETVSTTDFSSPYTDYIISEFNGYSEKFELSKRNLTAIYFGGGTASLLSACDVQRIVEQILQAFPNHEQLEITMENHPNFVSFEYLENLKSIGVNRVSFGIQSFVAEHLKTLGLLQTPEINRKILQQSMEIGFDTVSVDLIYRIPGQTKEQFFSELKEVVDFGVSSVSLYSMTLSERQEELYQKLPSTDTDKSMFYDSMDFLKSRGFLHIAQPDFCLPNHINQDGLISWKAPQGEQISLGAGAWSFFNGHIYCNTHNSGKYMKDVNANGFSFQQMQKATIDDLMSRYMVLGVRCLKIADEPFRDYFGISIFDVFGQEIRLLKEQGLLEQIGDSLIVSRIGKYYIDNISKTFYSPANRCRLQPYCYGIGKEWREGNE